MANRNHHLLWTMIWIRIILKKEDFAHALKDTLFIDETRDKLERSQVEMPSLSLFEVTGALLEDEPLKDYYDWKKFENDCIETRKWLGPTLTDDEKNSNSSCGVCKSNNLLNEWESAFCDWCNKCIHLTCWGPIGPSYLPKEDFFCRHCMNKALSQSRTQEMKEKQKSKTNEPLFGNKRSREVMENQTQTNGTC